MLALSVPTMAQDENQATIDAITKVIKSKPADLEDQVKAVYKKNKKKADVLVAMGRAFLENKDTVNATQYAEYALKADKEYAPAFMLFGDIAALCNDGGLAASNYQQAIFFDPKNPEPYIKYASVYRKRSPELSVQMLEKLRTVDPSYPVDAEAGHFFYTANKFQDAVKYYGKVDLNQLKDNYLTEFATAEYLLADSKKSLEVSLFGANKNPRSAAMNRITFYNYTDLKDYKNALKYADALFNNSDSAKISARDHQYYGYAYMGDSAFDNAIEQFKKALEMNAELNDVRKQLSDAYIAKGDFTNALAYYEEYLNKAEKKSVTDLDGLARLYMQQAASPAQTEEAKKAALMNADKIYGQMAQDAPSNKLYATLQRARINSQLDPETTQGLAKPYYEEYAKLAQAEQADNPKLLIEPYWYLGYYYMNVEKNNEQAKAYFQKVSEIDPENPQAKAALDALQ